MKGRGIAAIVIIVIVVILGSNTFYIINESEQAIITQFGKPIGDKIDKAGLHVKVPIIHALHRFEKRILIWDGSADQIPTLDKKYIWLDTTARWRIVDPLLFYQSVGNVTGALGRMVDIIDSSSRDVVSGNVLIEVVRNSNKIMEQVLVVEKERTIEDDIEVVVDEIEIGREKIATEILDKSVDLIAKYGIELLDVQIKRLNYIEDVRRKVYERMISERQRVASGFRSEGEGKKAEISGRKERELNGIQSEAYKRSQEIRGKADAQSTKIYADAYRQNPEFYSFLKSLEVYRASMGENSRVILTTDSDIYRYLKKIQN